MHKPEASEALAWNTRFTSTLIEFALLKVHLSFLLSRHLEGKLAADAKLTHKDIFLSGKDRVPSTRIHTVFSFCILYHYTSIFTGKVIFILYVLLKYLNFRAKNGYTQIVLLIFDTKISVARFSRNISKWDFLRDFQIISEWVSNQIRQCERSRKSSEEKMMALLLLVAHFQSTLLLLGEEANKFFFFSLRSRFRPLEGHKDGWFLCL